MEMNYKTIYQNWLRKDQEINNEVTIVAESYRLPLRLTGIITVEESELVKAEKNNNEAKNHKLFLEIMPAKGAPGLKKLMELLEKNHDEPLLKYLREVQGLEDAGEKMWGNIPAQNDCFVGRQSTTDLIKSTFDENGEPDNPSTVVVVFGLGGVGKTQVAAEFCHKNKGNYKRVVWISASKCDVVFSKLSEEFDLAEGNQSKKIKGVKGWFEKCSPCLIVFDDADNYDQIANHLPKNGCHVFVTSRYADWRFYKVAVCIDLREFTVEESELCVQKWLGKNIHLDPNDVAELGKVLGYLPLALVQACCYIRECLSNISDYVKMLNDRKHEVVLLNAQMLPPDMRNEENENTIMITWKTTKEAIRRKSPIANKLLSLCAYFQCDSFPDFLARIGFFQLNFDLPTMLQLLLVESPVKVLTAMMYSLECHEDHFIEFSKAMRILTNFSMLRTNMKRDQFTMPCLLQKVIKIQENDERDKYINNITQVMLIAFNYPKTAEYKKFRISLFLPHVLEHLSTLKQWNSKNVMLIKDMAAEISLEMTLFTGARPLFEDLLKYRTQSTDPDVPVIVETLLKLGSICFRLNDIKMAEKYFQDALNLCEEINASDQLKIEVLSLLHVVYETMKYSTESTRMLLEKAIRIHSDHLETEDRYELAGMMCRLGWLYSKNGEQIKAKSLFENAIKTIDEVLTSKKHISSDTFFRFGYCISHLKDLNVQKDLLKKYLALLERAFQQDDPEVIETLFNLSVVYYQLNDFGEAKELLEKVLLAQENYYGHDHPIILRTLVTLGVVLVSLKEAARSIVMLQKALTLAEKSVGNNDYIIIIFQYMSVAYELLGDTSKQEEMLEKAEGFPASVLFDLQKVLNFFRKNEPDKSDDISCTSHKCHEGHLIKKSLLKPDILYIADKRQLFEYVFFEPMSMIITTKVELIENNEHLINGDLKLTDQEMNELMHLVVWKLSQSRDVSLRAIHKLLKWPTQCLLPALDVFRLALTLDFVAEHFFQRPSDAFDLIDMFCRIAAKDTSATFQFRSVVCKIFANFFIFPVGCRCLSQCALEVVDVILSFCICSPAAEVQNLSAAALSNIILFVMVEAKNFDADKKLGISKRVFNCLCDMEAFGFNMLDQMCLIYLLQSLYVFIIGNSGQAFDQLVKDFDVARRLSKIKIELSKHDDEELMCLVDHVLTLYCNVV